MKAQHLLALLTVIAASSVTRPVLAEDATLKASDPQAQINLRSSPDPNSQQLGYGLVGDRVEILEQVPGADGYTWYQVRFYGSGAVGWIRNDFIEVVGAENPGTSPDLSEARYQVGYDQGYENGYRDGQNARRHNSGYHPEAFLQAGSGNPDPNFDRGFRAGFYAGFEAGYNTSPTPPANGSLLTFQTAAHAVRIFQHSGQTLMNVFDKRDGATWLNSVPVSVESVANGTQYRYQGEVSVLVFQGKDGTHTLSIDGNVETGS